MPLEHPPPPPPPGNRSVTIEYIENVLAGNYTEKVKLKAIKHALK